MASSSSFTSRNYSYNVFASFHGPDVRKTLLSHMRDQFKRNGITMFDDQEIERCVTISPSLTEAIRESRISIVILSKKYASSSWCLDELVEILKCKETIGQIVMTIFYGVKPSDVRIQTGEFGIAFSETCARKNLTDGEKQKWSKALNNVGNIAGEDFLTWDNEAKMIKKIARDVSDKLNATPSRDFDGMVGLESHLRKMECLLDLDYDGVRMVAISGPAGIGKTTIARALHSLLSYRFQLTCFVDNLRGSYHCGFDEYGLKLRLQEQLLSNILNQDGIRICHLGVIQERLHDQRVLIILDDVNDVKQLEALANEPTWFGPGSRIVVTTENKEILQQHGINNMYHVGFPSDEEALKILCRYAFRQSYPHNCFKEHAKRVTEFCCNLPLGLRVVGSSLRGKNEDEWKGVIHRLETILDRDIEKVLRVGYESLHEKEQSLFLHIAVFFNYKESDLVKAMFADNHFDTEQGLKILVNRSLIYISTKGEIMMHKLLQQVGTQVVHREKPWKRRIIIDAQEICDVLEHAKGTRAVSGISFDISGIDEVSISKKAFKRMPNLRFLRVYKGKDDGNDVVHIPGEMEFPRRLRLLHWEAYPSKYLPHTIHLEYLVELNLQNSQLEKLWEGSQPLANLKKMDLLASGNLKELPDLSKATKLEKLNLSFCVSLVEIPSSFLHLQKLQTLTMTGCINLEVMPAHLNLASLKQVNMIGCSRLRNLPVISTNIRRLYISEIEVEDERASIKSCSRLKNLTIRKGGKLKGLTHLPTSLTTVNLSNSDIERIPECIKDLNRLQYLNLCGCRRLSSLPELPGSLMFLYAEDCESLETVFFPVNTSYVHLFFTNCFKLGEQARKAIIRQTATHGKACLPGREVPAEFDHRDSGNSLTINRLLSPDNCFQVCLVVSPKRQIKEYRGSILCRLVIDDLDPIDRVVSIFTISRCRKEHLFIFGNKIEDFRAEIISNVSREMMFKFSSHYHDLYVTECGVQEIYASESDQIFEDGYYSDTSGGSNDSEPREVFEDQVSNDDDDDGSSLRSNPAKRLKTR